MEALWKKTESHLDNSAQKCFFENITDLLSSLCNGGEGGGKNRLASTWGAVVQCIASGIFSECLPDSELN